jgi:hypothetical protein
MKWEEANKIVQKLRRRGLEKDGSGITKIGDAEVRVALVNEGDCDQHFTYWVNGIEFSLRQLEHAIMMRRSVPVT